MENIKSKQKNQISEPRQQARTPVLPRHLHSTSKGPFLVERFHLRDGNSHSTRQPGSTLQRKEKTSLDSAQFGASLGTARSRISFSHRTRSGHISNSRPLATAMTYSPDGGDMELGRLPGLDLQLSCCLVPETNATGTRARVPGGWTAVSTCRLGWRIRSTTHLTFHPIPFTPNHTRVIA